MHRHAALAFLVAVPSVAFAEREIALTTNMPFRWSGAASLAGSVHVAVAKHHAIRANVISHEHGPNVVGDLISLASGGEGSEGGFDGRTTDVGIGWVYYPSEMFRGFTLELGALRRSRNHRDTTPWTTPEVTTTRTTTYGGRLLLGSSWIWWKHVFVAWGVGASLGRESGTESFLDIEYPAGRPERTQAVRRGTFEAEGYVRVGAVFRL